MNDDDDGDDGDEDNSDDEVKGVINSKLSVCGFSASLAHTNLLGWYMWTALCRLVSALAHSTLYKVCVCVCVCVCEVHDHLQKLETFTALGGQFHDS